MRCSRCNHVVSREARYCAGCGIEFKKPEWTVYDYWNKRYVNALERPALLSTLVGTRLLVLSAALILAAPVIALAGAAVWAGLRAIF